MRLGELVVGRGLATVAQVEGGEPAPTKPGRPSGENLIAIGAVTADQAQPDYHDTPVTAANHRRYCVSQAQFIEFCCSRSCISNSARFCRTSPGG